MKKLLWILIALLPALPLMSQKTDTVPGPWKFKGMTSLTFSQVSLSNWAQGGDNSMALNGLVLLNLDYTKGKSSWTNMLDMGYGTQRVESNAPSKTDDHLEFLSKYGYATGKNWFVSAMIDLKTQFTPGYKYTKDAKTRISDWMSPGYLIGSLGLEYKPSKNFYFMISPVAGKATFVLIDSLSTVGSFGVDAGKKFRAEMGAASRISLTKDIMKNVTLTTSVDFFSNLLNHPGNVDVNWKALLDMKINKFLSANFGINMVYDDNIKTVDNEGVVHGAKVQFKELLGVGLSAKF
jgi:hypothetical protein